ncbi:MAG: glycosyltransferase family 39 protein [Pseudomonadota bacterium]
MIRSSWLKDLLLLTLITSLFFGAFLGTRNLSAPDELRYSEIPREMMVNHDYVIPRINGVKYFEKPPLFYWMQVASIKTFGLNEWGLRFATAFMGVLGVLATYLFTRRLYDRKTGWIAALILSSMSLYFGMAHVITLDMTVSVFITMSIYLFYLATRASRKNIKYYMWGAFVAAAGAMMTKGLIGIIFPGAIAGLWFLIFQRWRILTQLYFVSGLLIFIALVAPWHILAQLQAPEFLNFYFIEQQFLRYATPIAHRNQFPLFYVPVILLGTLPWIYFLPKALWAIKQVRWNNRFQFENELFFIAWFLFVFLFFSASNSELIPYILPAFPPLAILIAHYLRARMKQVVIIYLIASVIFIAAVTRVDYFDDHTIKPLVLFVKQHSQPNDEVVAYHHYHQDLPYYLQRIITVNESFDELSFGMGHEDTTQWMIQESEFEKRWKSKRTVYMFISERKYQVFISAYPQNKGWIVARNKNDLVVVNHLNSTLPQDVT